MDLVEREEALSELTTMLTECARGHGSGAGMVSGGIGCGKSELLGSLKNWAANHGFTVLAAVGSWAERESPGNVLGQLLWSDAQDGIGAELKTMLARLTLASGSPGSERDAEARVPTATSVPHWLSTEILHLAERTPILICVDDVHFADSFSLRWLHHLIRGLRSARIAVVVSSCQLSHADHPWLYAELLRLPIYWKVALGRLSPSGSRRLLHRLLGPGTASTLAGDFYRVSMGNPLLLRALVEDFRHSAGTANRYAAEMVVADAFADAVLGCLHRGRSALLSLAQALAVLDDEEAADEVLSRMMTDQEPGWVERGLDALDRAGLLAGRRLRHPVARSAILGSLSPSQHAGLHRRAAQLLYEAGAAATRVSRHLLSAETCPEPWTVPVLWEAAERHLSGNQAADAYLCLNAALRACDDESSRTILKALLASAAWLLNPSISARYLGELTIALRDGRVSDQSALMLAKYLLWHGRFEEAADSIERLTAQARKDDSADRLDVIATRALLSASYPELVSPQARRTVPGKLQNPVYAPMDEAGGDPRIRAADSLLRVMIDGPSDSAVADAENAMRAMRLGKRTQEWLMCGVAALKYADRLDAAAGWCDYWLSEARARQVPLWEAEFSSLRASICLRQGDPKRARLLTEAALAQVPAESWGVCLGGPLSNLLHAATETGDLEAAAAYLKIPVSEGMFRSKFGAYYLNARGCYHLEAQQPYAALHDFMTCGHLLMKWGFDQPSLVPWRSGAARAYWSLGETRKAHHMALGQVAMAGTAPSRTRAISLHVLAMTSEAPEAAAMLAEAAQILSCCDDRLQLARVLADLEREYTLAGCQERARSAHEMAVRLAADSGAEQLLSSLRVDSPVRELDFLPDGSSETIDKRSLAALSRAEQRVAALAACGHTNRQIAEQLCITVSTVEQHLTSAFRKLGIKRRKELPREAVLEIAVQ